MYTFTIVVLKAKVDIILLPPFIVTTNLKDNFCCIQFEFELRIPSFQSCMNVKRLIN